MTNPANALPVTATQHKASTERQLDLFVAFIGDVPLRDDREGMSVPLVSLSKGKRTAPIEWRSPDGERFVNVTANAASGMATIWDMDVLIWAVSQINEAISTGREVSPVLRFHPHDMLKAIGRDVGGKDYTPIHRFRHSCASGRCLSCQTLQHGRGIQRGTCPNLNDVLVANLLPSTIECTHRCVAALFSDATPHDGLAAWPDGQTH